MIIDEATLRTIIEDACGDGSAPLATDLGGEWVIDLTSDRLVPLVTALLEAGAVHHLTAITGLDAGAELEVLYHFWSAQGLTLRVRCPRRGGELPSLVPILPAADWYEREVCDLLGVCFAGHPDLRRLVLPDDWDAPPPLLAEDRREDQPEEGA